MKTTNITAFPETPAQVDAIKAVMKALNIKFELKQQESAYNPEFVKMIEKGKKQIADGKGIKMSLKEFKDLCK
jgi:hypothetical protein